VSRAPESAPDFRVESEAFGVVVVALEEAFVCVFFGQESPPQVRFEPVEVGVPPGGPLGSGGTIVEDVAEDEQAAAIPGVQFDPVPVPGEGPGDHVWRVELGDFALLPSNVEDFAGFGLPVRGCGKPAPKLGGHGDGLPYPLDGVGEVPFEAKSGTVVDGVKRGVHSGTHLLMPGLGSVIRACAFLLVLTRRSVAGGGSCQPGCWTPAMTVIQVMLVSPRGQQSMDEHDKRRVGEQIEPGGRPKAPGRLELLQRFINTYNHESPREWDRLGTQEKAQAWLQEKRLVGPDVRISAADAARLRDLREAIRALTIANLGGQPDATAAGIVRKLSRTARLRVGVDDAGRTVLEPDRPGMDGAVATLLAILHEAQLTGEWFRLKGCRQCGYAFFDRSKNRSAAWCAMSICGNRTKNRAYRRRHA
jgi:predicted RNA-binding Zn ribbon-like protein